MKFRTAALAAAGALAAGVVLGAEPASADPGDANIHQIGTQATVSDGAITQGLTVSNLKPSSDMIPYQPAGALWEATATDEAIQGTVVPLIANFGARAANGQTYPALFTVPTAQGIPPATLAQGQKISGKIYFDVAGDPPNSVVYQDAGQGPVIWIAASPHPQGGNSGNRQAPPAPSGGGARTPTPSGGGAHNPAPPNSRTAPAPTGSQGTPLPESAEGGSQGTPLPAGGSEG